MVTWSIAPNTALRLRGSDDGGRVEGSFEQDSSPRHGARPQKKKEKEWTR
jgi:hypothetical protein